MLNEHNHRKFWMNPTNFCVTELPFHYVHQFHYHVKLQLFIQLLFFIHKKKNYFWFGFVFFSPWKEAFSFAQHRHRHALRQSIVSICNIKSVRIVKSLSFNSEKLIGKEHKKGSAKKAEIKVKKNWVKTFFSFWEKLWTNFV